MKLLVDMNLSPRWVHCLMQDGVQAVHWSSVGALNAPDRAIMAHALAHDFVVLTHDLDFGAILAATGGGKPSVVQLRADDVSPETVGAMVLRALKQMQAELEAGALVTIEPQRVRLRVLPIRGGH